MLKMKRKKPIVLYKGHIFTVECAIKENGNSESEVFFESLDDSNKAKIVRIIKRFADIGKIFNNEQFRKVEGPIWEFKNYQTRVLMYHCPNHCIALTHGFIKKGPKIPKKEIDRANQIKREYDSTRKGWK